MSIVSMDMTWSLITKIVDLHGIIWRQQLRLVVDDDDSKNEVQTWIIMKKKKDMSNGSILCLIDKIIVKNCQIVVWG